MDSTFFALLPLLLVIVLLFWGARVFRKNNGPEAPSPSGLKPYGVHGFLAFFVFVSYYITPIFVAGTTANAIRDAESKAPALLTMPEWSTYKAGTWLVVVGVIAWQIWVAKRLRNRFEPSSLRHAQVLCFASPWLVILWDVMLGKITLDIEPQGSVVLEYMKAIVQATIWGLYFLLSKRCKNTYLQEPSRRVNASRPSRMSSATVAPGDLAVAIPRPVAPGADERLSQLDRLRGSGLISDDEYARKRREIIDSL